MRFVCYALIVIGGLLVALGVYGLVDYYLNGQRGGEGGYWIVVLLERLMVGVGVVMVLFGLLCFPTHGLRIRENERASSTEPPRS
jgi:hypothetical protein